MAADQSLDLWGHVKARRIWRQGMRHSRIRHPPALKGPFVVSQLAMDTQHVCTAAGQQACPTSSGVWSGTRRAASLANAVWGTMVLMPSPWKPPAAGGEMMVPYAHSVLDATNKQRIITCIWPRRTCSANANSSVSKVGCKFPQWPPRPAAHSLPMPTTCGVSPNSGRFSSS